MTRLCVAIFVRSAEQATRDAAVAAEAGADFIELRIDNFTNDEAVKRLVQACKLPAIVTCRPVWEGGQNEGDDYHRKVLLHTIRRDARPSYIDLELVARAPD